MEIEVSASKLSEVLNSIANAMSAACIYQDNSMIIHLPKQIGKGKVVSYHFHDGLSLLSLRGTLREDLSIKIVQIDYHPLCLIFCREGALIHSIDTCGIKYLLNNSENSLLTCSGEGSVTQIFQFRAKVNQHFFIVEINRANFLQRIEEGLDTLHPLLEKAFRNMDSKNFFFYQGHYGVNTAEVLNQLQNANYKGLILNTFLEAKVLELLCLVMNQYEEDQNSITSQLVLWEDDKKQLLEARNIALENLDNPPSIRQLAKMVGMNEFKLKMGYKQLFKTTIYNHIRQERLNKARTLLIEGKWDVGEIARMVGYTNKSHFASKFKEKFGLLPKQFQKKSGNG